MKFIEKDNKIKGLQQLLEESERYLEKTSSKLENETTNRKEEKLKMLNLLKEARNKTIEEYENLVNQLHSRCKYQMKTIQELAIQNI